MCGWIGGTLIWFSVTGVFTSQSEGKVWEIKTSNTSLIANRNLKEKIAKIFYNYIT